MEAVKRWTHRMRGVEAEKHHITQLDTEAAASATSCNTTLGMAGMPHAHNTTKPNSKQPVCPASRGHAQCKGRTGMLLQVL